MTSATWSFLACFIGLWVCAHSVVIPLSSDERLLQLQNSIQGACKDCDASTILDLISTYKQQLESPNGKGLSIRVARPKPAWYLGKRSVNEESDDLLDVEDPESNMAKRASLCSSTNPAARMHCAYLFRTLYRTPKRQDPKSPASAQRTYSKVGWYLG